MDSQLPNSYVTPNLVSKILSKIYKTIKFFLRLKTIACIILIVILIRLFILDIFHITGNAMYPAIKPNMYILTFKHSYGLRIPFYERSLFTYAIPQRNDIITYKNEGTIAISRVIGLPNEEIKIRGKGVYINGKILEEGENISWIKGGIFDYGPQTIPNDCVFVMGDNRDISRDSRSEKPSFVPIKSIIGKYFFTLLD